VELFPPFFIKTIHFFIFICVKNGEVITRIKKRAYQLRHFRKEGFNDSHLDSKCIIHEIKFLFSMLSKKEQSDILNKSWLDD
jgi:hypothetical protein